MNSETMNPKNNVISKAVFLGCCFLTLFTSYNLSQGYLTTLFAGQGFVFIALIYFPYSLMALISAWIGRKIGLKIVLIVGSFTYVVWTLVITTSIYPLIVVIALINGLGAGLLWVHEGIWLSNLIKSDNQSRDGTLTGVFFGIYNLNGIFANLATMILVKYIDIILILRIMSGFTFLMWSLFWIIPSPDYYGWKIKWNYPNIVINLKELSSQSSSSSSIESGEDYKSANTSCSDNDDYGNSGDKLEISDSFETFPDEKPDLDTLRNHSRRLVRVWTNPRTTTAIPSENTETLDDSHEIKSKCNIRFPFLIPLMVQIALLNILSYGINSSLSGQSIPPDSYDGAFIIAGFFLLYSISSTIFSVAWGYIYDWFGWLFLLFSMEFLLLAEVIFIAINLHNETVIMQNVILSKYYIWWIIGLVAGIVDTGCNVLLNASITSGYEKDTAPYVFSWYRFIYCLSCALFSLLNYGIEPLYMMYFIIAWSFLTCLGIIIFKGRF